MNKNNIESFISFKIFDNYPLIAVFSTRNGGFSQSFYSSLNFSFSSGDNLETVEKNYKKFSRDIDVDFEKMVLSHQTHKDNILIVDETYCGMGIQKDRTYSDIDALYTETKKLPILTMHADCTPVFLYDKKRHVAGLVHSGWKGTSLKIAKKAIALFLENESKTADILCAIGPTICLDCYEVGDEVLEAIGLDFSVDSDYYYRNKTNGKAHLSLKEVNKMILLESGISPENIEISEFCTKCRKDLFFSHRNYGIHRGTHVACMCLM